MEIVKEGRDMTPPKKRKPTIICSQCQCEFIPSPGDYYYSTAIGFYLKCPNESCRKLIRVKEQPADILKCPICNHFRTTNSMDPNQYLKNNNTNYYEIQKKYKCCNKCTPWLNRSQRRFTTNSDAQYIVTKDYYLFWFDVETPNYEYDHSLRDLRPCYCIMKSGKMLETRRYDIMEIPLVYRKFFEDIYDNGVIVTEQEFCKEAKRRHDNR